MRRWVFLLITLPASTLCGCAHVIIQKGGVGEGYDVYRPEPYLLVFYQDTKETQANVSNVASHPTTRSASDEKAHGGGSASGGGDNGSGGGGSGGSGGSGGNGAGGGGGGTAAEGLNGPGALVIWLPNYSERYRIRSEAFLAQAGAQFTIRDGWMLTGITDQSDSSALLTAASTVLSSALGSASGGGAASKAAAGAKALAGETTTTTTQRFEMYKFLFDPDGNFYGLALIPLSDTKLAQVRNQLDSKARMQPLRAPSYDGRELETRDSRSEDSARKP